MFQIFIILFREILEISIILGIINASTAHIQGRRLYIAIGVFGGVIASLSIALSTKYLAEAFYDYAQELINGCLLLISACMMVWTVVWMKQHSHTIAQSIKGYGERSLNSNLPLISLSILTASLVLREGVEIILFSYGIFTSSHESVFYLFLSGLAGMVCALAIGFLIQLGILVIPLKYFFKITSVILSLIAAGMAAQAANFLLASGFIQSSGNPLWDSSSVISQNSTLGKILNVLIGYTSNPTAIELGFYFATLAAVVMLLKIARVRAKG